MNQMMIYILCISFASAVNYVAQESFYAFLPHVVVAMIFGTGAGLVVKYILVKKYAFVFKTRDRKHEAQVFFIYGLWGVEATLLFWGTELGFHYFVSIPYSRQVGTVLGLVISGYAKFIMDRDFVFVNKDKVL